MAVAAIGSKLFLTQICSAPDLPDSALTVASERLDLKRQLEVEPAVPTQIEKVLEIRGRTATILMSGPMRGGVSDAGPFDIVWKRVYDAHHFGLDFCVRMQFRWRGGGLDVLDYTGHAPL